MPGKLTNFLSELAVSPEKLASYQRNPDASMKEAGLDADEIAAMKSGDPAKVYACLSGQSASGGPPANCIWGAQPQGNCIWAAQPQANANCIWAAQPQPNCIWAAQPQAPTIWAAQPATIVVHHFIHAAQPQPNMQTPATSEADRPSSQPPKGKGAGGTTS